MSRKYVYYCIYYSHEHLALIARGAYEHHCLYVDGEVFIKLALEE